MKQGDAELQATGEVAELEAGDTKLVKPEDPTRGTCCTCVLWLMGMKTVLVNIAIILLHPTIYEGMASSINAEQRDDMLHLAKLGYSVGSKIPGFDAMNAAMDMELSDDTVFDPIEFESEGALMIHRHHLVVAMVVIVWILSIWTSPGEVDSFRRWSEDSRAAKLYWFLEPVMGKCPRIFGPNKSLEEGTKWHKRAILVLLLAAAKFIMIAMYLHVAIELESNADSTYEPDFRTRYFRATYFGCGMTFLVVAAGAVFETGVVGALKVSKKSEE